MRKTIRLGDTEYPIPAHLRRRLARIPDIEINNWQTLSPTLNFFTKTPVNVLQAEAIERGLDETFEDIAHVVTNRKTVTGSLAIFLTARDSWIENPSDWWEEIVNRLERLSRS